MDTDVVTMSRERLAAEVQTHRSNPNYGARENSASSTRTVI